MSSQPFIFEDTRVARNDYSGASLRPHFPATPSPTRQSMMKSPVSLTPLSKADLEVDPRSVVSDNMVSMPSSLRLPDLQASPDSQLPNVDLSAPQRHSGAFNTNESPKASFPVGSRLIDPQNDPADFFDLDSSETGDLDPSSLDSDEIVALQPEPLETRPSNLVRSTGKERRTSQTGIFEQPIPSRNTDLEDFLKMTGDLPGSEHQRMESTGGHSTRLDSAHTIDSFAHLANSYDSGPSPSLRPISEQSLYYPYMQPGGTSSIARHSQTGKQANSEKLKTMLGVYFLTLKEINKSFPEGEESSAHGSTANSAGRRTPKSAGGSISNANVPSMFPASNHPIGPPPPIPEEFAAPHTTRTASNPRSFSSVREEESSRLEGCRESPPKSAPQKKISMTIPPLDLKHESRKFSDSIGPRTPYPVHDNHRPKQQTLKPDPQSPIQVHRPPLPRTSVSSNVRKGSIAVMQDGSIGYLRSNPAQVSSDTVLTLSVNRRHVATGRRVTTMRIPADADQATVRKWSTAGLPSGAVAVESSVSANTATVKPATSAGGTTDGNAQEKIVPRMAFDDAAFFISLRKKYNATLLGSTAVSRFWRRCLAARCLKRIIVVALDGAQYTNSLPTTLVGNTTGSSAFPGRVTNPFASGSVASAPAALASHYNNLAGGARPSDFAVPSENQNLASSASRVQGATFQHARVPSLAPWPITTRAASVQRSPRFLARRGLGDTFSEDRMLAHFRRPRQGLQRFAWVYWVHRVARDVDEEYEFDSETGVVSSASNRNGPPEATRSVQGLAQRPGAMPGGLEFVEGWCCRRIVAFSVGVVGGGTLVCLLWIFLGPQDPLSQRVIELNGVGSSSADDDSRRSGLGYHDAEARVVAGAMLGLLWVVMGLANMSVWLAVSYMTM